MNANEDASCLDVVVETGVGRHQRVIMLGGPFVNEAVRHVRRAMKINVYHQLRQLPAAMNRRANCSDCHWSPTQATRYTSQASATTSFTAVSW